MATLTKTTCSNCTIDLSLDADRWVIRATVPSNGLRGSKHVPAHEVVADVWTDDDTGSLLMWDCPACGYADSFDTTHEG